MCAVIVEPHYLPSLEFFCALLPYPEVVLEKHEHFVKQSYRNRCHINTSQGLFKLVVPTIENHGKVSLGDVRLDPSVKWRNNHWRTIQSAYHKAPYFEFYADALEQILFQPYQFLFDLNKSLLSFCLRTIGLPRVLTESLSYQSNVPNTYVDLRNIIKPKNHHSNRSIYQPAHYTQVFGNTFVENLSVIDVLFCEGPNSLQVIKRSASKRNK
ncbi:MAG: WbqC family protein [Flammeovirgaceae bacterium]